MGIELILKITAIGILSSVVSLVLKHIGKEEIATFTTLASVIVILMLLLSVISQLFEMVKNLFLL